MHLSVNDLVARILYRDEEMIILDKPAGIAVHRGPKGGLTLDAFFPDLAFGKPDIPQLAHRLDRETSGCLVLGRDKAALKRLGNAFAEGRIAKTYCAIVCGMPAEDSGVIDLPLTRRSHDRRSWWMRADPAGDAALTRFRVLGRADGLAFLALQPETGRTHQLRVHCAEMGFPIAGDRVYGGDRAMAAARMLQLHAWRILLPARRKGEAGIRVTAPLPSTMSGLLESLGIRPGLLDSLPDRI